MASTEFLTDEGRRHLSLTEQVAKLECEADHLFFTRYFFKHRTNGRFRVNWHHMVLGDVVTALMKGKLKRVLINVSPGSSKTEEVVINFIARGLALNPWAKFLHLSYSSDLALTNSQTARDLVASDEYQKFWPFGISQDQKAKQRWNVMVGGRMAGGVYATALGGQVTGFRAGTMEPGFTGALIVDDPLKPEDAFSESKIEQANRRLLTTVESRLANPDVPIVVIMQRISEKDPSGFIIGGALGTGWTHITIPALIDDAYVNTVVPERYRSLVERDAPDRFSYWPYKEPVQKLLEMEAGRGTDQGGASISRHVFAAQYQQNPKAMGGNIIRGAWIKRYSVLPKIVYRKVFVDTAQKTKERNDYSVFACWGLGEDKRLYLLDLIRGKWEAPELEARAVAFWAKHAPKEKVALPWIKNWEQAALGQLREMKVEDKASGTGLIQSIKFKNAMPIKGVERTVDKLTRVMDVVSYIESGLVWIPESAPFTSDFVAEHEGFTADDRHAHDDQVDTTCDAIVDMLSSQNKLEMWVRSAG